MSQSCLTSNLLKVFSSSKCLILSTGLPRRLSPAENTARWPCRLPIKNLTPDYVSFTVYTPYTALCSLHTLLRTLSTSPWCTPYTLYTTLVYTVHSLHRTVHCTLQLRTILPWRRALRAARAWTGAEAGQAGFWQNWTLTAWFVMAQDLNGPCICEGEVLVTQNQ